MVSAHLIKVIKSCSVWASEGLWSSEHVVMHLLYYTHWLNYKIDLDNLIRFNWFPQFDSLFCFLHATHIFVLVIVDILFPHKVQGVFTLKWTIPQSVLEWISSHVFSRQGFTCVFHTRVQVGFHTSQQSWLSENRNPGVNQICQCEYWCCTEVVFEQLLCTAGCFEMDFIEINNPASLKSTELYPGFPLEWLEWLIVLNLY